MTSTLHQRFEGSMFDERTHAERVRDELEKARKSIPMDFLLRSNMKHYRQKRGMESIMKVFNRIRLSGLVKAVSQWKLYIAWHREEEDVPV